MDGLSLIPSMILGIRPTKLHKNKTFLGALNGSLETGRLRSLTPLGLYDTVTKKKSCSGLTSYPGHSLRFFYEQPGYKASFWQLRESYLREVKKKGSIFLFYRMVEYRLPCAEQDTAGRTPGPWCHGDSWHQCSGKNPVVSTAVSDCAAAQRQGRAGGK